MTGYPNGAPRASATGLPFSGLPLFDWAESFCPPRRPVLILMRRCRLPEATAAVVAELSGFGGFAYE